MAISSQPEARMDRTFIHIGYPKCASTYLQEEIYPQLGNYSHIVRAPNAEKYYPFNRDFRPEVFREYVQTHLKNPRPDQNHLLVSFEDWCELLFQEFADALCTYRKLDQEVYDLNNTRLLENMKQAYPDAHIVIIIREQISWINSRYKMLYRGAKTFMPVDEILKNPLNGYDQLIETAQTLFGKEKVSVIPFELIRKDKTTFIKSITDPITPDQPIQISDKSVNIAPVLQRKVVYSRIKTRCRRWLERNRLRFLYGLFKALSYVTLKPVLWLKHGSSPCADPCVEIPEVIKKRFEQTNRTVEALTGLDLKVFGYL